MRNRRTETPDACPQMRAMLLGAVAMEPRRSLPAEAERHLRRCAACRAELEEAERLDGVLSSAMGSARASIAGPAREDIDAILAAVREEPPDAKSLRRIRRSVKRLLLFAILALAFIAAAAALLLLRSSLAG